MNKLTKQVFLPALFTAGAFLSTGAAAFEQFDVDESVIPGTGAGNPTFTTDLITGEYYEVVTFGAGTFDISLLWIAGSYAGESAFLNSPGADGYNMYGLFQGSGTFATAGSATTFSFTPGGSLDLIIDPNSDSDYLGGAPGDFVSAPLGPVNGTLPWLANGLTADDLLVATGAIIDGEGTLDTSLSTCGAGGGSGINCGSFGTTTSFALTAFGSTYFVDPSPFYNLSFQSGQFDNFQVLGTQRIRGSLDVVFGEVPEPSTIALLGLGLLGLAGARRKKA